MGDFLISAYEWFICLCEAAATYWLFKRQLGCNKPKVYIAVALLPVLATATYMMNTLSVPWIILSLINAAIHIGYAFLLFRSSPTMKSLWGVVPVIVFCIANFITMIIFFVVSSLGDEAMMPGNTVRIIGQLVYIVLVFALTILLCRFRNSEGELPSLLRVGSTVLALIGIAISMYSFSEIAVMEVSQVNPLLWIQCSTILFLSIALQYLSGYLSRLYHKHLGIQRDLQKAQLESEHVSQVSAMYDYVRSWRHDIKGMVSTIKSLAKQGEYASMDKYMSELGDAAEETSLLVNTGNPAIDATLSAKLMLARKKEIIVDHTISIPENINISTIDICSVIMNLLDNAIEAASVMPLGERWVEFSMIKKKNMLTFIVSNTCVGKYIYANDRMTTTKDDPTAHGVGLARVTAIAKKYNGYFLMEPQARSFKATVMLPLEENVI